MKYSRTRAIWGVLFGLFLFSSPCYGHGQFSNRSGKPVFILDLNDVSGKTFAKLYMTGKSMSIDHYNYPVSGAGYYEALDNEFYYIPFTNNALGSLHVKKVEWDETGRVIRIEGLQPYFFSRQRTRISSNVDQLKLQDGILYLKLEGGGNQEYAFKIQFGIGVSVEPPLN